MHWGMGDNGAMSECTHQPPASPAAEGLPALSAEELGRHAEQAAQFLKLLANPHRLMVLCHLIDNELSVSELNEHLPLSQSALSQHLAVLRHAGLVKTRRAHQVIYYSLASQDVQEIMSVLHQQFCQTSHPQAEEQVA